VPNFTIDNKFQLSGAQEPATFEQVTPGTTVFHSIGNNFMQYFTVLAITAGHP